MELIVIQTKVRVFISHNCLFVYDLSLFSSLSGHINISNILVEMHVIVLLSLPQNY